MESINIIIPHFNQTRYLDTCLQSIYRNDNPEYNFVVTVIFDGYNENNDEIIEKYSSYKKFKYINFRSNKGFATALNTGVYTSDSKYVLLANDDNIFEYDWYSKCEKYLKSHPNVIFSINQIEPNPSMFPDFVIKDFGLTYDTFDWNAFDDFTSSFDIGHLSRRGWTFPILLSKRIYMSLGGFDASYPSNHVSDLDFFTKAEIRNCFIFRIMNIHCYHFGSKTMKSDSVVQKSKEEEVLGHMYYKFKWGYPVQFHPETNSFLNDQLRALFNGR